MVLTQTIDLLPVWNEAPPQMRNASSADWFDLDCKEIGKTENVREWVRPGRRIFTYHGIGTERDG
jgi:hypothetical protein